MLGRSDREAMFERAVRAFPRGQAEVVRVAVERMPAGRWADRSEPAWVDGEQVWLPNRLYKPPMAWNGGGSVETVLRCLYTRNDDGYVRQRAVEGLLALDQPWVVPFVVRLIGEYVIEIVEAIAAGLDSPTPPSAASTAASPAPTRTSWRSPSSAP